MYKVAELRVWMNDSCKWWWEVVLADKIKITCDKPYTQKCDAMRAGGVCCDHLAIPYTTKT